MTGRVISSSGGQDAGFRHPLWTLLTALSGVSDERERARLTVTGLHSLIPCCICGLALLDEPAKHWHLVLHQEGEASAPLPAEEVLAELQPLLLEAFDRSPLIITTVGEETTDYRAPSLAKFGVHILLATPLMTDRHRLGTILVAKNRGATFSRDEEQLLSMLAEHSAIAIETFRQLRRFEERQRTLLAINNAIVTHLDQVSLFDAISKVLRDVLDYDRLSLALCTPDRSMLKVTALTGTVPARRIVPLGREFPRQGSHLQEVVDEQRPRLRRDLEREPLVPLEDQLLNEGIRSYIAVPLAVKGPAFGTLNISSWTPNRYSDADVEFVVEVGQQIALALENMRAYEEIANLKARLERENTYLQEEIKAQHDLGGIVGTSSAIMTVLAAIETVAPTEANVLITGETGTGKELVAWAIHRLSARKDKPLIKVNCASIPRDLFESEFFGHVKGAFTGALKDRTGRFELADHGTLFLDEIGEIPLELQAKLLRVLQEGEYERIGEARTRRVAVRVIAATNRDLAREVSAGRFRNDLYYRLAVFPIEVPPLRSRPEDVPLLAAHFLERAVRKLNRPGLRLSEAAMLRLQDYAWPGNIRELQSVIERAVIRWRGGPLEFDVTTSSIVDPVSRALSARSDHTVAHLSAETAPAARTIPVSAAPPDDIVPESEIRRRERDNLRRALEKAGGRIYGPGGAAELLGMKPTTLASRIRKLGLDKIR